MARYARPEPRPHPPGSPARPRPALRRWPFNPAPRGRYAARMAPLYHNRGAVRKKCRWTGLGRWPEEQRDPEVEVVDGVEVGVDVGPAAIADTGLVAVLV